MHMPSRTADTDRAVPEVGNNESQISPTDHFRRLPRAVRMAQSVEAVTADCHIHSSLFAARIRSGGLGQGCVESSVEYCDLWNLWAELAPHVNAVHAGWLWSGASSPVVRSHV